MTEAQHTPGPWTAHEVFTNAITIMAPDEIASVNHGLGEITETERADARLISAAPDMLACLIEIRALITEAGLTGFNCHEGDWAERLFATQAASHAAVRKATGA